MSRMSRWNDRFLASTRGRVVQILRRGEASVSELAGALGLTDNNVRAHLATLERDGLVREAGKRPGVRKPETLYALTPEAEQLFPKAYHLLLDVLLDLLGEQLPQEQLDALLRGVGRRIAAVRHEAVPEADLRTRVAQAVEVLKDLGGLAELEERGQRFVICGLSCPLAAAATHHPEVCLLAESLLSELIGAPVQQRCEHEGRPRCVFEIG
jgi:predicted ArsR family transcriptional regulator